MSLTVSGAPEAVTDQLLQGVLHDIDENMASTWQGYLQVLAHAMRRLAVDHPEVVSRACAPYAADPCLRPQLCNPELSENVLATLSSHGFTDEQVAEIYRAFSGFLLGTLLLEAAQRGRPIPSVESQLGGAQPPPSESNGDVDRAATPTLTRLRSLLSEDHGDEEFEIALEGLLDRLERQLSGSSG